MADNVDYSLKRLEKLKQGTIERYLEAVNLDTIMGFYDSMIDRVFHGELDDLFLSKSLLGLDAEEKAEIFQLARKYKGLCFYAGNQNFWSDSIEGVTLSDVDLVCLKLFDNYDFLLGLSKDGGEQTLKQLSTFQRETVSSSGSTIDFLRTVFPNDDTLKDIVIEMAKEDGRYKGLTDKQKEILCSYPTGVLFDHKGDKIKVLPSDEILKRIVTMYFGEETDEISNFETLSRVISDPEEFESTVVDIYYDQQEKEDNYSK